MSRISLRAMMAITAAVMSGGHELRPGVFEISDLDRGFGGFVGFGGPYAKGGLPRSLAYRTRSMKTRWKRRRHLKGRRR